MKEENSTKPAVVDTPKREDKPTTTGGGFSRNSNQLPNFF
jgi:hypothetical protein